MLKYSISFWDKHLRKLLYIVLNYQILDKCGLEEKMYFMIELVPLFYFLISCRGCVWEGGGAVMGVIFIVSKIKILVLDMQEKKKKKKKKKKRLKRGIKKKEENLASKSKLIKQNILKYIKKKKNHSTDVSLWIEFPNVAGFWRGGGGWGAAKPDPRPPLFAVIFLKSKSEAFYIGNVHQESLTITWRLFTILIIILGCSHFVNRI